MTDGLKPLSPTTVIVVVVLLKAVLPMPNSPRDILKVIRELDTAVLLGDRVPKIPYCQVV